MNGPLEDVELRMEPPEDPLDVYAEWCIQRDTNLEQGNTCVPIPIAESYLIRLLCAFKKVPRHVIDLTGRLRQ